MAQCSQGRIEGQAKIYYLRCIIKRNQGWIIWRLRTTTPVITFFPIFWCESVHRLGTYWLKKRPAIQKEAHVIISSTVSPTPSQKEYLAIQSDIHTIGIDEYPNSSRVVRHRNQEPRAPSQSVLAKGHVQGRQWSPGSDPAHSESTSFTNPPAAYFPNHSINNLN